MKLCEKCGQNLSDPKPNQRYCFACSEEQSLKHRYKRKTKKGVSRSAINHDKLDEHHKNVSQENATKIGDYMTSDPDIVRLVRLRIPTSFNMSKNRLWALGTGKGHVFIRSEIRTYKNELISRIKAACQNSEFFQGKVWLDIFIQKNNARGDAINFLDTIADCVKVAIGIDDKWFSVRRIDWEIVKGEAYTFIGIGQEISEHHVICTHCGNMYPGTPDGKSYKRKCDRCRLTALSKKSIPNV